MFSNRVTDFIDRLAAFIIDVMANLPPLILLV